MPDNRRVILNGMSASTLPPFFVGEIRRLSQVQYFAQDDAHSASQNLDATTPLNMVGGGGHFQITPVEGDNRAWDIKALTVGGSQLFVDLTGAPFLAPANRLTLNVSVTAPVDNRRVDMGIVTPQ